MGCGSSSQTTEVQFKGIGVTNSTQDSSVNFPSQNDDSIGVDVASSLDKNAAPTILLPITNATTKASTTHSGRSSPQLLTLISHNTENGSKRSVDRESNSATKEPPPPATTQDGDTPPDGLRLSEAELKSIREKLRRLRRWLDGTEVEPVTAEQGLAQRTQGSDLPLTQVNIDENLVRLERLEKTGSSVSAQSMALSTEISDKWHHSTQSHKNAYYGMSNGGSSSGRPPRTKQLSRRSKPNSMKGSIMEK
eukprot:PhF_6_TR18566/c0_g1_i1/m.27120